MDPPISGPLMGRTVCSCPSVANRWWGFETTAPGGLAFVRKPDQISGWRAMVFSHNSIPRHLVAPWSLCSLPPTMINAGAISTTMTKTPKTEPSLSRTAE